uniref:Uncharacterized protein n=1 Tax=Ovis aries TaxID=9940 RepID=A0AC11CYW9_SHEEP
SVHLWSPYAQQYLLTDPQSLAPKNACPESPTHLEQVRQLLSDQFLKLIDAEAAFPAFPPCEGEEGVDHCLNGRLQLTPGATFAASSACPEPAPRLTVSFEMGSELETAMETLINVFHAHSGKEGDKYKLSKKELKELLQTELSGFLDAQKDADAVDKVMKELDENGDGEVDFQEYVVLVAALTVACNNFFWENS